MTFGERVKSTRERYGWTTKELSKMSGVPYETIWRLESGKHEGPRMTVASSLAKTLGVSLDYLTGDTDNPRRY